MPTPRSARRPPPGPAATSRTRGRSIAGLIVAALAVAVYLNALDNPFLYDDHDTVLRNASLVHPSNVRFLLLYTPFRPVVNVSYGIDRALWGYRPAGFHVTNVLLHAGVALLLYVFLLRALADIRRRFGYPEPRPIDEDAWAAATGAALFAVHPMMSEAAGYVSGRSELLCGVFFLATLLLARSAMIGATASGRLRATGGAVVCGALAFASKEVAAALPLVLLAYDCLILPSTPDARKRRLIGLYAPLVLLVAAGGLYRLRAMVTPPGMPATPAHLTLLTQAIVVWRYVGLLILPVGQSLVHAVRFVVTPGDPAGLLAMAAVAGSLALAFAMRARAPLAAFGIVWFFLVVAPSSSVVALREGMAEHRVYLAAAGFFFVITSLALRGIAALARSGRPLTFSYGCLLAGIVGVLSTLTVARNEVWASPVSVWSEAVASAPGMWEPHYALGDALREAKNCEAAVPQYEAALRLRPQSVDAHTNLGICLGQTGRPEEAEAAFREALRLDPGFARGYTNLATLALIGGRPGEARDHYLQAIAIDPRNVTARLQLARLYEQTFHDYAAAARMCGEARAIDPDVPGVVDCVERNQRRAAGGGER